MTLLSHNDPVGQMVRHAPCKVGGILQHCLLPFLPFAGFTGRGWLPTAPLGGPAIPKGSVQEAGMACQGLAIL